MSGNDQPSGEEFLRMSREQRQAYYFAGKPPELTQEQRDQLPPSEWDAYGQDDRLLVRSGDAWNRGRVCGGLR